MTNEINNNILHTYLGNRKEINIDIIKYINNETNNKLLVLKNDFGETPLEFYKNDNSEDKRKIEIIKILS
jgi:hypothetical protein